MRRARARRASFAPALVIHDAAILLALCYAPIFWGGFGASGLTMAATLVSIAALCALIWPWGALNRGPAVIPNAIHLPALLFLAISALTALFSASSHASALELSRLTVGLVLFLLVANRALLPAAPALPVVIIFASSLLVIPFVHTSGEMGAWLDVLTGLAVASVCAFLLAHRHSPDPVRRWTEAVVLTAGLALALFGIREKIFTYYVVHNTTWQIFGTFFNQNELAGYLALVIPVALAAFLASQKRWGRLPLGFAALAMLLAILPTSSKGAYLALLVALAVLALLLAAISQRPRRNLVLVLGLYALAALGLVALIVVSHGVRAKLVAAFGAQSASNIFRLMTWKGTLLMAAHHLCLGIGPGAFKSVYMNYAVVGYTEAAHESYLQVLAEQGVFGAMAFLWLLGAILFTGWRALRRPGADRASRLLAAGGLCGVIALMAHSLLDYGWYIGATNLTLWFFAGVLAHLSHGRPLAVLAAPAQDDSPKTRRRRVSAPAPARPTPAEPVHRLPWPKRDGGRAVALLAVACALSLCVWVAARNALAQDAMSRGDAAMTEAGAFQQQGDLASTESRFQAGQALYQQAADDDPGWAEVYEKLGLYRKGDEGERLLTRAIALEPMSYQPYLSLARFYNDVKRFPQAAAAYQDSLRRFPQNARALRLLAQVYQQMGDEQKALDIYQRMIALQALPIYRYPAIAQDVDVNYAFAHYELGRADVRRSQRDHDAGQLRAALDQFNACLTVIADYFKPNSGYALDLMFAQAGRPRTNRADELLPLKAKALWRMAEAYNLLAQPQEAAAKRNQAVAASARVVELVAAEDRGERK